MIYRKASKRSELNCGYLQLNHCYIFNGMQDALLLKLSDTQQKKICNCLDKNSSYNDPLSAGLIVDKYIPEKAFFKIRQSHIHLKLTNKEWICLGYSIFSGFSFKIWVVGFRYEYAAVRILEKLIPQPRYIE